MNTSGGCFYIIQYLPTAIRASLLDFFLAKFINDSKLFMQWIGDSCNEKQI